MRTKLHIYEYVGGPGPAHACSLVGSSVSVSSHGLVASVGPLVVSLTPLAGSNWLSLSPTLPRDSSSTTCCLAVGLCICFHPLLDEASQETVMLGSCLKPQQNIINRVWGRLFPIGWLSSWASHCLTVPSISAPGDDPLNIHIWSLPTPRVKQS